MDQFVDRESELARLQDCYESEDAEMVVIFGRRRLGKTELVRQSLADRDDVVMYQATETTKQVHLDEFVDLASESFPGVSRIKPEWESLLGYLAEQDAIIVLDEFPYLIDADDSLPSVIQRLWDYELQETAATLILVGSSISMMEEATLLGNSPLYGRFTEKLDLRQFDFGAARKFFPASYTPEEQVFAWGVFGGTPYYLDGAELDHDLGTVIQQSLLAQQGFLHNEPEYVLRTELTEPDKTKSRRGRYRILDPLFRFWFRFVYGNEDRYDRLNDHAYEAVIEPEMADFVSHEFETFCQNALPELYPDELFTDIGRWWYKEHEVDVVGLTVDGTMVTGECKFTNSPLDYNALASLEEHTQEIRWSPDSGDVTQKYALFARNGFTQSVRDAATERDNLRLFDLEEIVDSF